MTPSAVLFDMDGVVIDSEPTAVRVLHETAGALGFVIPEAAMAYYKGLPGSVVYPDVARRFGNGAEAEIIRAERDRRYLEALGSVLPLPGAVDLISGLSGLGVPMALVTSSKVAHAELVLHRLGIRNAFGSVLGGDTVSRPKPHPAPYRTAAAALKQDPSDCTVVEDSLNGIRSALGAGCTVIGLTGSFVRAELEAVGAHRVIESLSALIQSWLTLPDPRPANG